MCRENLISVIVSAHLSLTSWRTYKKPVCGGRVRWNWSLLSSLHDIFVTGSSKIAQLITYTYNLPLLARRSHSRVPSTEPTFLSPSTKEYRALDILTSIPIFFFGAPSRAHPVTKVGAVKMCLPNKRTEFQSCL